MRFSNSRWTLCPFQTIAILFSLLLLSGCLPGQTNRNPAKNLPTEASAVIQKISVTDGENVAIVKISGNRRLRYSSVKKPVDPPVVTIYFPETRMAATPEILPAAIGPIRSIRPIDLPGKGDTTGLEITVTEDVPYEITIAETDLLVTFTKPAKRRVPVEAAPKTPADRVPAGQKTAVAAEPATLLSIETERFPDGVRIHVRADRSITDYTFFTLDQPPNIVFDLKGVKAPDNRENRLQVRTRWIEELRYYGFQDGVRIVLTSQPEYLSHFSAHSVISGLTIAVGRKEDSGSVVKSAPPAEDTGKPAWIESIDFITRKDGNSSLVLESDRPVLYKTEKETTHRLLVTLFNTRIPERLAAVRYENAHCRIESPRQTSTSPNLTIPIQFHRKVPYFITQTEKRLVIRLDSAGLSDLSLPAGIEETAGKPQVTVPPENEKSLLDFLHRWKTAWEKTAGPEGDTDAYIAFYSNQFSARGLDRAGWQRDRQTKNSKRPWIKGRLIDVKINPFPSEDAMALNFFLEYLSPNYTEVLDKTLVVRKGPDGWKIIREVSRKAPASIRENILKGIR